MRIDRHWARRLRQGFSQASAMVIVTVTQRHRIQGIKVNAQSFRIFDQHTALAGVEKKATVTRIDPCGQSMLGPELRQRHAVFDQVCDGEG